MSIELKIHQGTGRLTGQSLCLSCRYAHHVVDGNREIIRCSAGSTLSPLTITSKVFECNEYYNRSLPSINLMHETAWTLRTEKGGRAIGFEPPRRDRDTPR